MSTRRSFFSRLAGALATIALAPELAFRAKLALPEVESQTLVYACNQNGVYAQLLACGSIADCQTQKLEKLDLEELFRIAYEIKKKRQERGISEHYYLVKIES